jgi:plastocyanin
MEGLGSRRGLWRLTRVLVAGMLVALVALPASASAQGGDPSCEPGATATEQVCTYRVPITVSGYEVKQDILFNAPRPEIPGGAITKMHTDVVDANGEPVPINRLMLHHIVFLNLGRLGGDATCDSFTDWDSETVLPAPERFYAAGEERARLFLPPGYGYRGTGATDDWIMLYMVMNHRKQNDIAFVEYTVTVDTAAEIQHVRPYWLEVAGCSADPIYNVDPSGKGSDVETEQFDIVEDGRIIGGGGHVHGGARRLTVTQPDCDNRQIGRSVPAWGERDHPFYNVRPILHEPGPMNMSAFGTAEGIPVEEGQTLQLNSIYEQSLPHTRVMGIMLVYVAPDPSVEPGDGCSELPSDLQEVGPAVDGTPPGEGWRPGPVKFRVPLTGLKNGRAVTIKKPPGPTIRMKRKQSTIKVGDNFFAKPNISVPRGTKINWRFISDELHNVTLANGPDAIGSPNLSRSNGQSAPVGSPRVFSKRFSKPGTYRLFCGLHPVQMSERIIVRKNK